MLLRMWSNRNSHSLLVETLNGTVSVEGRWAVSYKAVHTLTRESEKVSPSDVSNSLQLCGLQPTRLLCPWHSPGKNIGVVAMPSSRRSFWPRDQAQVLSVSYIESSRKTSVSALLTMPKPLTMWITTNCGKVFKRWEYQTTLPSSSEISMQVKKQQLEPDMEQQTGSKLGNEYVKAI